MKIKQIIKLLEVIEGKLPSDMYELGSDLYERDDEKYMSISDMDFVHLIRAFKKALFEIDNDGNVAHLTPNPNIKLDENVSELLEENQRLVKSKIKLKEKLSESVRRDVYEMLFDKCTNLQERIEMLIPEKASPYYTFYEIPNDCEGQEFTDNLKKYVNKDRYTLRLRGQYLDKSKLSKGESWRDYERGQPIDKSTHIRVYIDEKKEEK